jgi:hypothetical protein
MVRGDVLLAVVVVAVVCLIESFEATQWDADVYVCVRVCIEWDDKHAYGNVRTSWHLAMTVCAEPAHHSAVTHVHAPILEERHNRVLLRRPCCVHHDLRERTANGGAVWRTRRAVSPLHTPPGVPVRAVHIPA